jgi:hypothetical protein
MNFLLRFLPLLIALVASVPAAQIPAIQEPNEWNDIEVEIASSSDAVRIAQPINLVVTYRFKQIKSVMNLFAFTHDHPHPIAEVRFFTEDGSFYTIVRQHVFSGSFPDCEYLMYPGSSVSFTTSIQTKGEGWTPRLKPGSYKLQVAVYDLIARPWPRKDAKSQYPLEAPSMSVLLSNVVQITIRN